MENGEPSVKRIKTEPVDEQTVTTQASATTQTRLVIDPQRVQHLQEITKQFDSKHSKKIVTNNIRLSPKTPEAGPPPRVVKPGRPSNLEKIIYRLNPEACVGPATSKSDSAESETPSTNDSEKNMATRDTGTQTAVSMVQLIKSIIRDRMKALQDSVFKDATVDNLMNGKLIELRKENKELKECLDKLQTKYDELVAQCKIVRKQESSKKKQAQGIAVTTQTEKQTSIDQEKTTEVSACTVTSTAVHSQPPTTQSTNFIALQNSVRVAAPRVKVGTTQAPPNAIRSTNVGYSPSNRPNAFSRVAPQQLQQSQPPAVQATPGQVQPQQQLQTFINLQANKVNSQGALVNVHQHAVNPPGVIPAQPQAMTGQGSIMNASGQLLNSKGQPIAGMPGQIRPTQQVRYEVPHYISPTTLANIRPTASTQVVFASQGSRVTSDLRLPSMPPNYEQATGSSTVHYTHSTVGPRPRMVQPPPNYVVQSAPGPRQVVPSPQHARKHDGVATVNAAINRTNVDSLPLPPRLNVTISAAGSGIVLSWDVEAPIPANAPSIECYHLFAYQDGDCPPRLAQAWKRIGVVKALPLPMACTLTQFVSGSAYHFAIMAVDMYGREGPMSNPCTIRLSK